MTLDAFLLLVHAPRAVKSWYTAACPAHDDRSHNTLKISAGREGRILVKCWAACSLDEILRALHLDARDLFPDDRGRRAPARRPAGGTTPWRTLVRTARRDVFRDFRRRQAERTELYTNAREIRAMTWLIDTARTLATDTGHGWTLLARAAALERDLFQREV